MSNSRPEGDARARREQLQNDDAADGDGLARATRSEQVGAGLDGDDAADGEQEGD